jgi:hypothetical protein
MIILKLKMKLFLLTATLLSFSFMANGQNKKGQDSITVPIAPEYDQVGKTHRFFLGDNYRRLWAIPVKMRILDIRKEKGGLKILKLGGGNQTRSIRFEDAQGKEWVLRTIQKYPERSLPESLKPTIAKKIVQDQVSTGHPFAALVVPPLAAALHIPHANPEIVYIGDDPGLMEYRKDFANAPYLFEEREPVDIDDTDNTEKVQRKLQENNDNRTDQKLTLRARLLDFIVGDWDRHEDNWRWQPVEDENGTFYEPIPRDRDKVFYKTSGVLPWILSHQWLKSNLQPYSDHIRDVNGWNYNNRYFDRYFLNALSASDWLEQVQVVQKTITPALVDQAINLMPAEAVAQSGREVANSMNGRIANLREIALEYYSFLAKTVEIPASDKGEQFDLRYEPDATLSLTIRNIKKDGSIGRELYQRIFDPTLTSEIRLYGMGGEDKFLVEGNTKSKIKVRMIGGADADQFTVAPDFANKGRVYLYDRLDEDNKLPADKNVKLRLSNDSLVNSYDKKSFMFDRFGPQFRFSYSLDQGLEVGAGIIFEKQGFRKVPYAFRQNLWVNYTTGRKSFNITYAGDFKKAFGNYDFKVDANLLGPNNLSNFFGLGNETQFINEGDFTMDYYRNRYDYLKADFKLARTVAKSLQVEGGISTEFYTSRSTSNTRRFLNDFDALNPDRQVFADQTFLGLVGNLIYDTRDAVAIPTKGIYWNTGLSYGKELGGQDDQYGRIQTEFRSYINPNNSGLVIANRIGAGTTIGAPKFFQRMQLGGIRSLRGFHTNRFTGRTMLYYNLDLRMKLFNFTSYIVPGTVGLIAFNDIGRVWEPSEQSNKWHDGYGGGFYVIPAELLLIQGAVGFSKEGALPYISIGFSF